MDAKIQQTIHQEIEKALSIARSLGSDYRLRIEIGYPPLINDSEVIEALRKVAIDLLGEGCIQVRRVEMGAEDFSFMTAQVPGAMFSLGCGNGHDVRRLHSSNFDIDERCLPIGVAILAETAIRYLNNE
jgi:metal-dependent amidase/aminoacylase/carboxypeptidase family protein